MNIGKVPRLSSRGRRSLAAGIGVAMCAAMVPIAGPALAAGQGSTLTAKAAHDVVSNYDSRTDGTAKKVLANRAALQAASPRAGVKNLRNELGWESLVDIDALTGTPRRVTKLDGFLTGPNLKSPDRIARDYISAHADAFGLTQAEVASLVLRQAYVDIQGTSHLSYIQQVGGVDVFGNGVRAHVTKAGQLAQVDGSPVAALPAALGAPGLTAEAARDKAVADTFGSSKAAVAKRGGTASQVTDFVGGDQAKLVVFETITGPRLAWQTLTMREGWIHVIDAKTGRTLFRQSMSAKDNAGSDSARTRPVNAQVWTNFPGAPIGGTAATVDLAGKGWLAKNATTLTGNTVHVWLDLNDDNLPNAGEEVGLNAQHNFVYPQTAFTPSACPTPAIVAQFGGTIYPCSWDPSVPYSWQTNASQNAVQMFSFINTWSEHLLASPIGFTRQAGNFDARDGDAIEGNALDGANVTGQGLPDGDHIDNANFNTPPDGFSPRMQMYLFHQPGYSFPADTVDAPGDPFLAGNSGDEADVVFHEFTHGLSNRLVVDANGVSTLGGIQAGSMGEAWSDWYAMDYLVNQGLFTDTKADGELRVGQYVGWGQDLIRTQPMDCGVNTNAKACPGGGYTYGDFGKIAGGPEVHADGEIWAATLWDLRTALGSQVTESLVTRAMELSPSNPSFLDERNSILAADLVVFGGSHQKTIWQIFAKRGMGWFAGSVDGNDTQPVEDFSMPPGPNAPRGDLTGTVTNPSTGTPISGVAVAFGGHNSGFAGQYAAMTDANGHYTITGILAGTYPKVFARGAGFDPNVQTVKIAKGTTTLDWSLRRDWAASAGGATVVSASLPDYTDFGCGPGGLIDQSTGTGWGSDAPNTTSGVTGPKNAVIQLPVAVNLSELQVSPANTCGDPGSASTGDYLIETSTDGTTWTVFSQGHFGIADRPMHVVAPAAGALLNGVKFVRYTMQGTQAEDVGGPGICSTNPTGYAGCSFMDSTELAVYGPPA